MYRCITVCKGSEDDGVEVRYQNVLIRYAEPKDAPALKAGQVIDYDSGLPAIWLYSPMRDRLRKVDGEWKIIERYIGGSASNKVLTPQDTSAAASAPFLPTLHAN